MTFTCNSGVSPRCVGRGLFDPYESTTSGEPICIFCARQRDD